MALNHVIVVGGGLAGCSAAHAAIEHGCSVTLLDKNPFLGGNSVKATSGINGAGTLAQADNKIPDNIRVFEQDSHASYWGNEKNAEGKPVHPLIKTMTYNSAAAIEWITSKFGLDLSLLGQLGGHSFPRTHRGKEKFPGMTITYALMEGLEKIEKETNGAVAKIIMKANVKELIKDGNIVNGVRYETRDGKTHELRGAVILATGGYGADFTDNSLLKRFRPDLLHLPTTNGDHCTGDGIKLAESVGGGKVDMERVQVHPTGLVNEKEPDAKLKFLAAEALRGTGAIMLDANGKRFCNELGRRDYVTGEMNKNKGPFRLLLNSKQSAEIHWHCKHYQGRGLMKYFEKGEGVAQEMKIDPAVLKASFDEYNKIAESKKDPFGKRFFKNAPFSMDDNYFVAIITPIIHYCMGGVYVNERTEVLTPAHQPVKGLFAAGEIMGGVHGVNRLGGNSLLDCVVFGRVAGEVAASHLLQLAGQGGRGSGSGNAVAKLTLGHGTKVTLELSYGDAPAANTAVAAAVPSEASTKEAAPAVAAAAPAASAQKDAPAPAGAASGGRKVYTRAEVAKHNKESDVWVIVGNEVLDVTKFLADHPGGKNAIMLFAGKDATEEFDMLHNRNVIPKYAPDSVIGTVADAKL